MDQVTVTLSDFARQKRVSLDAVTKAIKDGRLRESVVKTQGRYPRLLPDVAMREWGENTSPALQRNQEPADTGDAPASFAESRAKREHYQAELARLELEAKQGALIPADDVKKQAFTAARQVRDQMLNLPDRLAAELAACSDQFEVHRLLTGEIRKALETALSSDAADLP